MKKINAICLTSAQNKKHTIWLNSVHISYFLCVLMHITTSDPAEHNHAHSTMQHAPVRRGGESNPIAFYAYLFFGHVGHDEMWTTNQSHCHMLLICRHWSLKPHSWYRGATCSVDCVVIRPWIVYQEHQLLAWWCQDTTGANHDTSKYDTNSH